MRFVLVPAGPYVPDPFDPDETWRDDPDDCRHEWVSAGMTDYGTLYECTKCGGLTP
jgi:hypothetical protein